MEHEICLEYGWRYRQWAELPKYERIRLMAFFNVRGQVKRYGSYGGKMEEAGITLEEWLGLSEDGRKVKVQFLKARK